MSGGDRRSPETTASTSYGKWSGHAFNTLSFPSADHTAAVRFSAATQSVHGHSSFTAPT